MIFKKGYQIREEVVGTTAVKVKGFGLEPRTNNFSANDLFFVKMNDGILSENSFNIYDSTDYVIPPNEYNSVFIMTSKIQTEQTQGTCEEVCLILSYRATYSFSHFYFYFKRSL